MPHERPVDPSPHPRLPTLSPRQVRLLLALVLLFGAGLRVWYALPDLHAGRFWDERYNFDNVEKILATWSLLPAKGYYPSPIQSWPQALTVAASQKLSESLDLPRLATLAGPGRFTPTAYLLVRLISVVYGTASLAVVFLIGRRLFSNGLGLAAALGLAAMPWHIHASSKFKPDALLVLAVLLAFFWSIAALERARARDYALAGFGICLAMSAKIMGGLVSLPLAVGTAVVGWRDRKRLALLALAAIVSLGTFLILNPYARWYLGWVSSLQDDYAMRARWQGMTFASMPVEILRYLFGPTVHGPLLGTLALAGLAGLAVSLWRQGDLDRVGRAQRAMLVSFPLLYAPIYGASTPYFKGNNMLPVVPFTLLAGLWLLAAAAGWVAARLPRLGTRPAVWAAGALLAVLLAASGPTYVYRSLTPTTADAALRFLEGGARPAHGRTIFIENVPAGLPPWEGRRGFARGQAAVQVVERVADVPPAKLDLSDGELFPARRLDGPAAAFYRGRVERVAGARVATFDPGWFALRGPPVVAVRHRRRTAADGLVVKMERCAEDQVCFAGVLPADLEAGDLVSLTVSIPFKVITRTQAVPPIRVGDREVPLLEASRADRAALFVSERFRLASPGAAVRFTNDQGFHRGAKMRVVVSKWRGKGTGLPGRRAQRD